MAKIDRKQYERFLDIYHYLRPYLSEDSKKRKNVTRSELVARFPKDKQLAEDVWKCVFELKLVWPEEMKDRIFTE